MNALLYIASVDPVLIDRCRPRQRLYHSMLGLSLLVYAFITALAVMYVVELLGASHFFAGIVGLLFAGMLLNLYRFFFITISCRATYDTGLKLTNHPTFADAWRLSLLGFMGTAVSLCLLVFLYRHTIHAVIPADEAGMGMAARLRWLYGYLGALVYNVLLAAMVALYLLPMILKLYFRPFRNGEYEWLRNQFENQRIRDQYTYMKDAYTLTLKEATGSWLRKDFSPGDSFVPDPFTHKLLDPDARVNIPIAMVETIEYKAIEKAVAAQKGTGRAIQDCDYCGEPKVSVHILESGLARCMRCQTNALEDENELHKVFAEALAFFETHHVQLPRYIRPRFATPQEIAAFDGETFTPTPGFDKRAIGLAAAPHTTNNLDTIFIERGFSRNRVFATIIHELVHVWQFNNLSKDKLDTTGKSLLYLEGLARWAELDALEKHGEYELLKEMQEIMSQHEDEYALGYELMLQMLSHNAHQAGPFDLYLKKFGK